MTFELITALITFALVASITPGPNNLMLLASGLNFGFVRTIPHIIGICSGFGLMVVLVGMGLAQIFTLFPITGIVLKIISMVFLIYLAWKIATAAPLPEEKKSGHTAPKAHPMSYVQALFFQIANPKAWMMILAAIGSYAPSPYSLWDIVIIAAVFSAVMLPAISLWAYLGTKIKMILNNPKKIRIFNVLAALALLSSLSMIVSPS